MSKMWFIFLICLPYVLATLTSEQARSIEDIFTNDDTDKNNVLTYTEVKGMFAKFDKNNDGIISREEHRNHVINVKNDTEENEKAAWTIFDVNSDKVLNEVDYKKHFHHMGPNAKDEIILDNFKEWFEINFYPETTTTKKAGTTNKATTKKPSQAGTTNKATTTTKKAATTTKAKG